MHLLERLPLLMCVVSISVLLACSSVRTPEEALRWQGAVDTLTTIGVAEGDQNKEFVQLIAAAIDSTDRVFLLDLRRPGILAFNSAGQFLSATPVGAGPAEVRQPWAISVDADDHVVVADLANGRLSRLRVAEGSFRQMTSIPLSHPVRSICILGDHTYAGFLFRNMMVHELGSDGEIVWSFSDAPPLEELQILGDLGSTLARRQVLAPVLYCDESHARVIVAASSFPLIRAFDTSGTVQWQATPTDVTPVAFQIEKNGAIIAHEDAQKGASFVRSIVRWDADHLLIQYEVRMPGSAPGAREFHRLDSRLLVLESGIEVARTDSLPLLAASRGDLFVILDNTPYPRAVLVRRHAGG